MHDFDSIKIEAIKWNTVIFLGKFVDLSSLKKYSEAKGGKSMEKKHVNYRRLKKGEKSME